MSTPRLSFHESTVVTFERSHDVVRLGISDVNSGFGKCSVRVEISDVSGVLVDGAYAADVAMEHEDGEVLTLDVSDTEVYLVVEWNDFKTRNSVTRSYRIKGSVNVELCPRTRDADR